MRIPTPLPLLVVLLAPAVAEDDEPVLITKHETCFVHALVAWPTAAAYVERVVGPGHALLYTSRETGEMKRLIQTTGTVALNTRRISYRGTRLLGVRADAERLYAVMWFSYRMFDPPREEDAAIRGGRYELRVFWLADGGALPSPPLGPEGLPSAAPSASLGPGPLRLVPGGVSCFGKTVRYDGPALQEE